MGTYYETATPHD